MRALEQQLAEALRRLDEAVRSQKRQAAPFSKGPPKENPKKPGRKPGDEYGQKVQRVAPTKIDEVIEAPLAARCGCGGHVVYDETVAQYQEEIRREPIRRRIDIDVGHCDQCGQRHQGRHPLQTSDAIGAAAPQLGPNAQAMTALMKTDLGLSYSDIQKAMQKFYGISLSRGGAAQIVLRTGDRVEAAYRSITFVVRRSRVLYPDETGWKVGGWLQWLWTFVSRTATLFTIRDSRGHDVPEEILGLDWSGAMIHDGWAPYDFFKRAEHQQCLGHIMRRCKEMLEGATRGAVRFPRAVLALLKSTFGVRDRRDADEYSDHGLLSAVGRLKARLDGILLWELSNPANVRLRRHLSAHRDQIFTFLTRRHIEATNWPAEQAIRPAVVNRKVFGGNREPTGARAQERLASIVATCVQRGIEVFDYLSRVIRAAPSDRENLACRLLALPLRT